jgi:regulation of enolase protein 1 (concanavalin A-like superfamily)
MTPRQRFLLAVAALLVLPALPRCRAGDDHVDPDLIESFNGKFRLSWKVERPDKDRWSLTKNKGKLTITTQRGTIHRAAQRKDELAKNLFLVGNPYRGGDFEVSVCVCDFEPTALYQQAGLLLYADDNTHVKFVWESKGDGSTHLVYIRETEDRSDLLRAATPENKGKVWLRLTRRKSKYEYASSGDGKKWTIHGEEEWLDKAPAKLGVLAMNGPSDAPEIDTCFTDFRARVLKPKEE